MDGGFGAPRRFLFTGSGLLLSFEKTRQRLLAAGLSDRQSVAILLFRDWTAKYGRSIDGGNGRKQIDPQGLLRARALPGAKTSAGAALCRQRRDSWRE